MYYLYYNEYAFRGDTYRQCARGISSMNGVRRARIAPNGWWLRGLFILSLIVGAALGTRLGVAQQTAQKAAAAQAAKKDDKKGELQIPERRTLTLVTRDGVTLFVEYYPGGFVKRGEKVESLDGKRVVPLILLHGWGGRGADWAELAQALQQYGYAVAVPDLRGHGRSTVMRTGGGTVTLDPERMNPREITALLNGMIEDVDTVKAHLLGLNNKAELNIELLGVVGSEMGALVAMNWAAFDWSKQSLPAFKQGKDVKLLVLLSPPESFRGLNNRPFINHPVSAQLFTMIAFGAGDRKAQQDAERLYRFLEKRHPQPSETLKYLPVETSLQGTQLLRRGLPVAEEMLRFLYANLNQKVAAWPWMDRTIPLGQ